MDFTGIVGLIVGFGLVVFGIISSGGELSGFVDMASVYITIGGTAAATLCAFPIGAFKYMGAHMRIAYGKRKYMPRQYIDTIVDFAQDARRKGILSLEDKVMEQSDEFLRKSVMLIVDAIEPAKAKMILENELDCLDTRHTAGVKIYEKASSLAPAFGMIGTLVGLVSMLKGLDLDAADGAAKLTGGMATALLTTLYGSLIANLVLTPIANKLRVRHAEEMLCKEIIVEGVLSIQSGDNPKNIEERLLAYINQNDRDKGAESDEGGEGEGGKKGKKPKKAKAPKKGKGEE